MTDDATDDSAATDSDDTSDGSSTAATGAETTDTETATDAVMTALEPRTATVTRQTAETETAVELTVDGNSDATVSTGVGFFHHMLESFAKHGLFDLRVQCDRDLEIDDHYTVEDW